MIPAPVPLEPELVPLLSVFFLCLLPDFFPGFELPVSDPDPVLVPDPVEEPLDEPEPLEPVPLPVPVPVWAKVSGIRAALNTTAKKVFFIVLSLADGSAYLDFPASSPFTSALNRRPAARPSNDIRYKELIIFNTGHHLTRSNGRKSDGQPLTAPSPAAFG